MGQQQLLLLVLSTVIVGLATVAGIQAFSQNQIQANGDQLASTALEIASDAQAYAEKPNQLGGGSLSDPPGFSDLGYDTGNTSDASSSQYGTNGGIFEVSDGTSGIASNACTSGATLYIHAADTEGYGNEVCVEISGTSSDDITTNLSLGS